MSVSLAKPVLTLIAEYVSGNEFVKFFESGIVHTFFDDELEVVQQSQDFFDFVAKVVKSCSRSGGYLVTTFEYNVVANWQDINECFALYEEMSDNQKVLFEHVLSDYSYSYDLSTLTNYCLENACLYEGSASDYAYELIQDCYDLKSMGTLANYIDYDKFAHDMLLNSEIIELDCNLFWTNPNDIY